jgi:anti-sigma-K factor RskA
VPTPDDQFITRREFEIWDSGHAKQHDDHLVSHEREHGLMGVALAKADEDVSRRLENMNKFRQILADQQATFMTIARFDREHAALTEKVEAALAAISEKLGTEERVTLRQDAQAALLEKLSANNRWLIGLAVGIVLTLGTTVLHLMKVI